MIEGCIDTRRPVNSTVIWLTRLRSDTKAPGSPKVVVIIRLTWLALIVFSVLPYASAQQVHSIANLVERIVREREPSFKLISRDLSAFQGGPGEDDLVSFNFKLKDQVVYVGTTNQKTIEAARFQFGVSTITQITRRTYKLTPDGEKLNRMADQVGFFRNNTAVRINVGHPTFDVAFRKGKVVIVVESRKPEIAQKIALYIAENLPAT